MSHSSIPNIALMFVAVLFLQSFAFAQSEHRPPPPPMGGQMPPGDPVKEMKRVLQLTDEQTAKIEKIFDSQRDAMEKMMDASDAEREAMRASMEKSRKETDEKISNILTEKQRQKFLEMKKKHQQRRPERMPEPDHEL